jgi:hypothetical protein
MPDRNQFYPIGAPGGPPQLATCSGEAQQAWAVPGRSGIAAPWPLADGSLCLNVNPTFGGGVAAASCGDVVTSWVMKVSTLATMLA